MRMVDIIQKKKSGLALTDEEIRFFVSGVVDGSIPDYQTSALLMAICFVGMQAEEILSLTLSMVGSGETMNLSEIPGVKVDKHSTGGVGDKTTLVLAPLVAACGVPVAKMSGRGLGHTGGTIDKLESIPGFSTALTMSQFIHAVKTCGLAIAGQTGTLVPADKKLYALRDVTATISSIPLIAASIMSKKIASGADAIVLDVKVGSGSFMDTLDQASELARTMVRIGRDAGRKTVAVLTDMDQPLGYAIGNSLEVEEAIQVLRGSGPDDVRDLCLALGTEMLQLAGMGSTEACLEKLQDAIQSGAAIEKLKALVLSQGGDPSYIDHPEHLPKAKLCFPYHALFSGQIQRITSDHLGIASMLLGAGRRTKEEAIDPSAGILLIKKPGDNVSEGEVIAYLHSNNDKSLAEVTKLMDEAIVINTKKWTAQPLVLAVIA